MATVVKGTPLRGATVKVKAKTFHVANASDGHIVHFDPADHAVPSAKEPTILLADYPRFLREGYIEASDEAEAELNEGSSLFVPAGGVQMVAMSDVARIVDEMVQKRLAGIAPYEDAAGVTTSLSTRATTAFPPNQPVPHVYPEKDDDGALGDDPDAPPAPTKRGRKQKASGDDAASGEGAGDDVGKDDGADGKDKAEGDDEGGEAEKS